MRQTGWRGSMTVELAIVFPVVFFTILGVISLCLTHYQNTVTAVAGMQSAARGAAYWDKLGGDLAWDFQAANADTDAGRMAGMDYSEHDPYRNLFDTDQGQRLAHIQAYAQWLMGQNPEVALGEEETSTPRAEKSGGLLQKYVTVTVEKQYTNPLGNTLERLGLHLPSEREIVARAPLNTPTDFIRDMTFLYDQIHGTGG